MAKLIGFSENITSNCPRFRINNLIGLEPPTALADSYSMVHEGLSWGMVHEGLLWGIGYQKEIRYFLDDGTHVDFIDDLDGQVRFLKDYIANGGNTLASQKLEIASEVEFMDI